MDSVLVCVSVFIDEAGIAILGENYRKSCGLENEYTTLCLKPGPINCRKCAIQQHQQTQQNTNTNRQCVCWRKEWKKRKLTNREN